MHTERPARELWFTAPRAVDVREAEVPRPGRGQVLVRALASGISQGTERLLYRGEGPTPFDPSLDPPGTPTYPRRYGYAWVGEIAACGAETTAVEGTRVFGLLPHGDWHAVDEHALRTIDRAIPASRAVLAANLETAITCVWDAGISLGDEVVVIGGGIVGLLAGWLASRSGARVRLIEASPKRRALGTALGAIALAPDEHPPQADADVVIEASGDPASLDRAIAHAGVEAVIAVASFYGVRRAPIDLGDAFHRRRISLRASQVSRLPPARAPRWDHARRFDLVRRLLGESALDALLDPLVPFDRAAEVYELLDGDPGGAGQIVFDYRS